MIHVRYKIKESKLHGIGLFTDQDIEKDAPIYTPNPLLDVELTSEQYRCLHPQEQQEVAYYGYFNKKTRRWHVAFEPIRFLNHGQNNNANVTQNEDMIMTALRDVKAGEELLQDYTEIYQTTDGHFERMRNPFHLDATRPSD